MPADSKLASLVLFLTALQCSALIGSYSTVAWAASPLCGQKIQIGGTTYNIGTSQNGFCTTRNSTNSIRILTSPSGLAHAGSAGVFVRLRQAEADEPVQGVGEFWAAGHGYNGSECQTTGPPVAFPTINPFATLTIANGKFECHDSDYPANDCGHAYVDISDANTESGTTWYPTFGGPGSLGLYVTYDAPGGGTYQIVVDLVSRSTDIDFDGDTDEDDENLLRTAIADAIANPGNMAGLALTYDLNFDANAVVNQSDLLPLVTEANRRDAAGVPYRAGYCYKELGPGDFVDYNIANYKMYRPEEISNLSGSCVNGVARLAWTATGDDSSTTGDASSYEIRCSTSQITESNYANATPLGTLAGLARGTTMTFDDSGASGAAPRYYAVKAQDDMLNWSAMSNVVALDCIPPAAVTLGGTSGPTTQAVTWNAPGDDGDLGTATQYDLRFSTATFTAATFSQQQQLSTPSPGEAGTLQCVAQSGLISNTYYFYALKTRDDQANWSTMSPVRTLKTKLSGGEVECGAFRAGPSDPEDGPGAPAALMLDALQGERGRIQLSYGIPLSLANEPLELAIFDLGGRRVHQWAGATAVVGRHVTVWQGSSRSGGQVPSGFYYARLRVGGQQVNRGFRLIR